jgi:exosortase family protein XrtM
MKLRLSVWRRALPIAIFVIVYCVLYALLHLARGGPVERLVIHEATVAPAAGIARTIDPASGAHAVGNRIESARGNLVVQSGCEGTETLFLLWAAIAAFPAGRGAKMRALAWGSLLIYTANQARLVTLFFASVHHRSLFALLHGYVAPVFLVLLVAIYFLHWTAVAGDAIHEPTAGD